MILSLRGRPPRVHEHSEADAPEPSTEHATTVQRQRHFTGSRHRPQLPSAYRSQGHRPDADISTKTAADTNAVAAITTRELERQIGELKQRAQSFHNLPLAARKRYAALIRARSARQSQRPAAERFDDMARVFRGDPATSLMAGGTR